MPRSADPRAYFSFVAKMTALLADYSREDLVGFRELAMKSFPGMATLLGACMDLADDKSFGESGPDVATAARSRDKQPLLDLLCSTELFPTNKDLVSFAKRALPEMSMKGLKGRSRGFIADRVLSHLNAINGGKREQLERAMRDAINSLKTSAKQEPQSFFSQWEKIIKGMGR